ncbi:MAG: hypothetical protein ACRERD_18200, partial [Candidatus Binatia bacterium]
MRKSAIYNPQSLGLPLRVREVIGRRFDHLTEDCRRVLQVAAVVGREFTLTVVEASLRPAPTGGTVLALLDEAVAARLITPVPQHLGRYSFSHALIRETLYEELSTSRRVSLHSRIGAVLEEVSGAHFSPHPSASS